MDALQTIFETIYNHMSGKSLWLTQLEALDTATAKLTRPYLQYFWAGGGNEPVSVHRDNDRLMISVKAVAENLTDAMMMQAAITSELDNSGLQDTNSRLPSHAEWYILTVTKGRVIYLPERITDALSIYHAGYQFEFFLERK